MNILTRLAACLAVLLFLFTSNSRAQDEERKDAEGCKDSPLITRFPGSIINSCDNKEYEQADLPWKDGGTKHVEGDYHYWDIATRQGTSAGTRAAERSAAPASPSACSAWPCGK